MKVTLIRPQLGAKGSRHYDSRARMEPTALAYLAGLTPPDVELTVIDDRFETVPYDDATDLVGLSLCTFSARRGYEIAAEYRKRGVPTVVGGFHPTLVPHEALRFADAVAVGQAEDTWPQILSDARQGKLQRLYRGQNRPSLRGVMPDWSVFRGKRYAPISSIQFTRGCHHTCDFCSIRAFYGGKINHRPIPDVLADIERAGRRRVFFVDDNIIANRRQAQRLFEAIRPLNLRWTTQIDIDFVEDPRLFESMVRSGCQCLIIGFESLNPANLAQMNKGWARVDEYRRRLAKIRSAGIMVYGTFVIGYDHDNADSIRQTLEFAQEEKLFVSNFNPLQPFPGTPLYDRLLEEGRLSRPGWWMDPDYTWGETVFTPHSMTAQELTEGCYAARLEYNKTRNILKRFLDFKANCGSLDNAATFLFGSFASRDDLMQKLGRSLGEVPRPRAGAALVGTPASTAAPPNMIRSTKSTANKDRRGLAQEHS
jgi:radical SAM superfamily enzyme YgiQ (UPF0313 family)